MQVTSPGRKPPGHPELDQAHRPAPVTPCATPLRCEASDALVALTTSAVLALPQQQMELVGVPLGAILSPSPSRSLPTYPLEPSTCVKCGAFINVYAPASGDSGEWHCNFCLHLNRPNSAGGAAAPGFGGSGGLSGNSLATSPMFAAAPGLQQQQDAFVTPPAMPSLGASSSGPLSGSASGNLASAGSGTSAPATPLAPQQARLQHEAVDYITPAASAAAAAAEPSTQQQPPNGHAAAATVAADSSSGPWVLPAAGDAAAGVTVLVVDLVATPSELATVREALLAATAVLPAAARVALVAAGTTVVQAYRLGGHGRWRGGTDSSNGVVDEGDLPPPAAACDVLPGDVEGAEEDLLGVLRPGVHVAPAGECREALAAALWSLRPSGSTAKDAARPRCIPGAVETALHLCQLAQQAQQQQQQQQQHSGFSVADALERFSLGSSGNMGAAVEQAPQQAEMDREGSGRTPGHVVVITTGRATQGYSPPLAEPAGEGEEGDAEQPSPPSNPDRPPPAVDPNTLARLMNGLANRAALAGVSVDILAAGADPDHIPALSPLAQGTAGLFVQHKACDESFAANVTAAARRPAGLTAGLEVRTSSGLGVRDTYGAVVPLFAAGRSTPQWKALTGGASPPPPRWLNRRTWHYRCGPPSNSSGVTLVLDCDKPPMQTYAYIQVVWSWVDESGARVQRVITRRLRTTHNPAATAEALVPGVAAVVWAKSVLAQALERGAAFDRKEAEILRRSLGKQLFEFVSKHGFPVESSRGWFTGPTRFLVPAPFLRIARALYCLHRGPMLLHSLGGHPEERALLQAHFMTSSLQLSTTMCTPALYVLTHLSPPQPAPQPNGSSEAAAAAAARPDHGSSGAGGGSEAAAGAAAAAEAAAEAATAAALERAMSGLRSCFQEAPAVDLSLTDCPAAVLDHGSHVFVWLAPGLAPAEWVVAEAQCRRFALSLGADRVPAPEVVVDSAQCLLRLAPIRSDPLKAQLAQAPALASLSRAALERSAAQLGPSEELSFLQWLDAHGLELEEG